MVYYKNASKHLVCYILRFTTPFMFFINHYKKASEQHKIEKMTEFSLAELFL